MALFSVVMQQKPFQFSYQIYLPYFFVVNLWEVKN